MLSSVRTCTEVLWNVVYFIAQKNRSNSIFVYLHNESSFAIPNMLSNWLRTDVTYDHLKRLTSAPAVIALTFDVACFANLARARAVIKDLLFLLSNIKFSFGNSVIENLQRRLQRKAGYKLGTCFIQILRRPVFTFLFATPPPVKG